jgi:hypothetical protein
VQEGNLGAPVLFAAQDGALPEKHRQELLQAAFRWIHGDLTLKYGDFRIFLGD